MSVMNFQGQRVFLNPVLTKTVTTQVRRTWRERLCTRPWRPLTSHKSHSVQVASDEIIQTPDGLFMHPDLWDRIKATMDERKTRHLKENRDG